MSTKWGARGFMSDDRRHAAGLSELALRTELAAHQRAGSNESTLAEVKTALQQAALRASGEPTARKRSLPSVGTESAASVRPVPKALRSLAPPLPAPPPSLKLSDFPVGRCEVLTPRTDSDPTFQPVIGHKEGMLLISMPGSEPDYKLGLEAVSRLRAKGREVRKPPLQDAIEVTTPPPKRQRSPPDSRPTAPAAPAPLLLTHREGGFDSEGSFLSAGLFHLNPWLEGPVNQKRIIGFGPFIRASAANVGFEPLTDPMLRMAAAGDSKSLRKALVAHLGVVPQSSQARWTAMWCATIKAGDYIIMRHQHAKCQYRPLKLRHAKYENGVYVIGVVKKLVTPYSREDRDIAKLLPEIPDKYRNGFHRVNFFKMGLLDELEDTTRKYIMAVQQLTLNQICKDKTRHEDVRRDLWKNATESIQPSDFKESFGTGDFVIGDDGKDDIVLTPHAAGTWDWQVGKW